MQNNRCNNKLKVSNRASTSRVVISIIQELVDLLKVKIKFVDVKIRSEFDPRINRFSYKLIRLCNG